MHRHFTLRCAATDVAFRAVGCLRISRVGLSMQKQLVAQQSDQMQVQWAHEEHKVRYMKALLSVRSVTSADPVH